MTATEKAIKSGASQRVLESANNPNATLIGFTDADMYSVNHGWPFTFTERNLRRANGLGFLGRKNYQAFVLLRFKDDLRYQ